MVLYLTVVLIFYTVVNLRQDRDHDEVLASEKDTEMIEVNDVQDVQALDTNPENIDKVHEIVQFYVGSLDNLNEEHKQDDLASNMNF